MRDLHGHYLITSASLMVKTQQNIHIQYMFVENILSCFDQILSDFPKGHIRPRKSYKSLGRRPRPVGRPRRTHPYAEDSYAVFNDTAIQYTQQLQNTRIKTEPTLNHSEDTNVNNFHSEYES